MTDRCESHFLWLKMKEQSLKAWKNLHQLQNATECTLTALGHIYQRNWDKIERNDRAVALLRWTVFAVRPLTVSGNNRSCAD